MLQFSIDARIGVVLVVVVVLCAAAAHADTVVLQPAQDNTLYEPIQKDNLEDRSNGVGEAMFTGLTKDAKNADDQIAVAADRESVRYGDRLH